TRTRARARSGAGQGETSRLEVQPVMQLAPRVEPAAARGAAVPAVEVLPDGQHVAARAAQHRGRVEPLARPAFGRVRLEFGVTGVAGVELPAAGEADGDDVERPVPVRAARLGVQRPAVDFGARITGGRRRCAGLTAFVRARGAAANRARRAGARLARRRRQTPGSAPRTAAMIFHATGSKAAASRSFAASPGRNGRSPAASVRSHPTNADSQVTPNA